MQQYGSIILGFFFCDCQSWYFGILYFGTLLKKYCRLLGIRIRGVWKIVYFTKFIELAALVLLWTYHCHLVHMYYWFLWHSTGIDFSSRNSFTNWGFFARVSTPVETITPCIHVLYQWSCHDFTLIGEHNS